MKQFFSVVCLAGSFAINSDCATISFENYAPVGSLVNVSPESPYTEQGYTVTPANSNSAVFDAAAITQFPGDNSDWFGFAPGNTVTLTGPVPFNLDTALVGPSTLTSATATITITGTSVNG